VRDDVRQIAVNRFGDPDGVLVVDETGDLEKGIHSAGVQRQYTGPLGGSRSWPTTQSAGEFFGSACRRLVHH
jgi:SRSO17 transposase